MKINTKIYLIGFKNNKFHFYTIILNKFGERRAKLDNYYNLKEFLGFLETNTIKTKMVIISDEKLYKNNF